MYTRGHGWVAQRFNDFFFDTVTLRLVAGYWKGQHQAGLQSEISHFRRVAQRPS